MSNPRAPSERSPLGVALYGLIVLLAVFAYLYGLDGRYIPKNGDEAVYFHITRLTAQSGHLLPLQSELDHMRNTKPPLLFWQGIWSTDWGAAWSLWRLRLPSVLYTFASAAMAFALARKMTRSVEAGLIAALALLAFFSTYRYGRPFLTNPPEVFWLFLPFFALLMFGQRAFESRWLWPLAFGLVIGVGLLYKSFALALPVGFGLAWWHWSNRNYRTVRFLIDDSGKLIVSMTVALAMFALWFVFDPDPRGVWQEFVVGENAEKFDAERGYLKTLLWGASSIGSLALNYPLNAGLLAVPAALLFIVAFLKRRDASREERLLWIWIAALFLVFTLPSQRSGRYLLAAMPALAVLLAVHWYHITRYAYSLTLLACTMVAGLIGYLSYQLRGAMPAEHIYSVAHWSLLLLVAGVAVLGLVRPRLTRPASLAAVFLVYLVFASTVAPMQGRLGNYSPEALAFAKGKDVRVPCNFRAAYEGYRFLLPGANVLGYDDSGEHSSAQLAARFNLFTVRVPLNAKPEAGYRIIGERLEIRGRHTPAQIDEMLRGRLFENLFMREWLVQSSKRDTGKAARPTPGTESECR